MSLRQTSPLLASALAALLLAFGLALVIDHLRQPSGPPRAAGPAVADRRAPGERELERGQDRLAAAPDDPRALAGLAQAHLLRARETGDPGYYGRADALLARALGAQPDNLEAILAAGSLALSRHDFADALELGRRAVQLAPYTSAGHGVLVDALVELGRYDEAVEAAERMVGLRPDLASYSRIAYLRELHGDLPGAVDAMRDAVLSGAPGGEATAWSEVQLGHLRFATNDLAGAESAYRSAARRLDGYVHGLAGQARVKAARGDPAGAAELYERAARAVPLPEFVIALGHVYARQGDQVRAEQQYALVEAMQRLLAANGVRADAELALFDADRGVNLEAALETARAEYARRPSVQVADALAWVEYRAGYPAEALVHSRAALRLGTRDPLMLYHAGVIAQANGRTDEARALLQASYDLNPRFSIRWSDDLTARLRALAADGGNR
jgi:tetratricopeptide (TPR) repeat protein